MRSRRPFWRIAIVIALVFTAPAWIFLTGYLFFSQLTAPYQAAAAKLPEEIKAARREGLPLTPGDLKRLTPVADPVNAALLYRKIVYPKSTAPQDAALSAVASGNATQADRAVVRKLIALSDFQLRLIAKPNSVTAVPFGR